MDRGGALSAARFRLMKSVVGGASGLAAVGDAAVAAYRPVAGPGCVAANLPYVCDVVPFLAAGADRPGPAATAGRRRPSCTAAS